MYPLALNNSRRLIMGESLPEIDRIKKALWGIANSEDCPKTIALDALDKLLDIEKSLRKDKVPATVTALDRHRKAARGEE